MIENRQGSPMPEPRPHGFINGRLIDAVRENMGLTREQYAHLCGIPAATMKRICTGKNPPSGPHLLRLQLRGGVNVFLLAIDGWEKR